MKIQDSQNSSNFQIISLRCIDILIYTYVHTEISKEQQAWNLTYSWETGVQLK